MLHLVSTSCLHLLLARPGRLLSIHCTDCCMPQAHCCCMRLSFASELLHLPSICLEHIAVCVCGHQAHLALELLLQVQCWILFCQLGCRPAESADSPIHWSSYWICHNPPQDRTNHCNHHCFDHDPGEDCLSYFFPIFFSIRLCTVGTMLGPSLLTGQQCC